jgi:hypothetical protein
MKLSPNSYSKCAVHLKNAFRIEANFYVIWDTRLKLTKLFMENRVGLQKLMIDTLHKSKASSLLLQCPCSEWHDRKLCVDFTEDET